MRTRALGALGRLPPFSPILNRLMASLAGEDVSFNVLGDLIEKDTVLAGNILRVVNSAAYARRGTINSVRRALALLGLEKVRNTVLAMSISRMLNAAKTPAGFSMERFDKHSVAVAMLSDLLAQHAKADYPEGAFVAGLLHDLGRLLIAMGLPNEFQTVLRTYENGDRTWIECEQQVLGFTHATLSADALAEWKLPLEIQEAVLYHHDAAQFSCVREATGALPLASVLNAANQYVNYLGHSVLTVQKSDASGSAWIEALGMGPETTALVISEFHAEHGAIADFYH
ncbi:MAG: HDOD domain-containing protein [Acidobacteriota bacterium]